MLCLTKEYLQFIDGQITLEEATQEAIKHNFELARAPGCVV